MTNKVENYISDHTGYFAVKTPHNASHNTSYSRKTPLQDSVNRSYLSSVNTPRAGASERISMAKETALSEVASKRVRPEAPPCNCGNQVWQLKQWFAFPFLCQNNTNN